MSVWTSGLPQVVNWWTATYTAGLASSVREARRTEIASDVWEQTQDRADDNETGVGNAIGVVSRMVRGMPADLLWRVNVEGPKMDIKIPFERIVGGLFLALIVLLMITAGISGYDTSRDGFDGELRRLAEMSTFADNANAFFRGLTGLTLIGGAAALYVNLKDRSPVLASIAVFGIAAAGVLALIAGALQLVFVELAEEYVASSGAHQEQVLVTARGFAVAVHNTTGTAFITLVLSVYVLAILAGREALVPRWLIGIPIMSAALTGAALIADIAGAGDGAWIFLMSGLFMSILWLLIAGLWLLFMPKKDKIATNAAQPAAV